MSDIIITRGLPASGKSTFAKKLVQSTAADWVRVNRDAIRWTQGFFPMGNSEQEALVTVIEEALVVGAIRADKDIVIDSTHLNPTYIHKWFKIAKAHGVRKVEVIDFEVPIVTLFERDANREKSVGQGVISKLANRWKIGDDGKLPNAPVYSAAERPNLTPAAEWDENLPTAIIVDTDGTLANHEGVRNPYDTSKYAEDTVHEDVARVINNLAETHFILGVSGRDEKFHDVTTKWWESQARVGWDEFYMRPEGDERPDDVIKAEIYENHFRGRYNIAGVFDDRGRVLRMWRSKGLTTFAVGDTDNYNF